MPRRHFIKLFKVTKADALINSGVKNANDKKIKKISSQGAQMAVAVRYLTKTGCYPPGNFQTSGASYLYDEPTGLLLSTVSIQPYDSIYFESGTAWALLSEIRLWSSLILTLLPENGSYAIIPAEKPMVFKAEDSVDSLQFIGNIQNRLSERENSESYISGHRFVDSGYDFHHTSTQVEQTLDFYHAIDPMNKVLIRGLSCMLKAKVLSRSYHALEEAALLTYISTEAVFALLVEKLQLKSVKELYAYIEDQVPNGYHLANYHKDCRENRNNLVHPSLKFGAYDLPNLIADDYMETYSNLVELYRFYILNLPIQNDC